MRPLLHSRLPSWRLIVGTAATALVASLSLAFSRPAVVNLDGQRVISDVAPVTAGGVAYLPLRAVSDAAGAVTTFDPANGTLLVRHGAVALRMKIGDRHATLNGRPVELAHAPFTVHGRAMVRGIDVANVLASAVHYDARRGRIDIRTAGAVVAGAPEDSP